VPPDPQPAGEARVAAGSDRELLESWSEAFGREVDDLGHRARVADERLSYGGLTLREVDGGGAVTGAVSQAALAAGAQEVVLFTDLANPTSNALYPRLGYRPIEDMVILTFRSGSS
jgi:hypothetical protein